MDFDHITITWPGKLLAGTEIWSDRKLCGNGVSPHYRAAGTQLWSWAQFRHHPCVCRFHTGTRAWPLCHCPRGSRSHGAQSLPGCCHLSPAFPSQLQAGWHCPTAGTVACLAEISVCSFLLLAHRSPTKNCLAQTGLGWFFNPATRESKAQGSVYRAFEHRPESRNRFNGHTTHFTWA